MQRSLNALCAVCLLHRRQSKMGKDFLGRAIHLLEVMVAVLP